MGRTPVLPRDMAMIANTIRGQGPGAHMAVSVVVVGAPVLGGHPHCLGVGQCRLNLALLFLKRFQESLHRVWAPVYRRWACLAIAAYDHVAISACFVMLRFLRVAF